MAQNSHIQVCMLQMNIYNSELRFLNNQPIENHNMN